MYERGDRQYAGKVLITAPSFRDYGTMIGKAFEFEGWRTHIYNHDDPSMSSFQAIRWVSSSTYRLLRETNSRIRYNREVCKLVDILKPDLCLTINGDKIDASTVNRIKENGALPILWCYDSITHCPRILENITMYENVYVFEPTDIPILRDLGVNAKHLAMGYDPSLYHPIPQAVKRYDLSFIGSIFSYPDRLKLLKRIVRDNRDLSVHIWTNTPPYYSPWNILKFSKIISNFSRSVEMRTLTHQEVNERYNSSRICLNVHHPQCKEGLNPRTFEILGSGSFQLVDYHKQIDEMFHTGHEITPYRSHDELQNQIEDCLEKPDKMMRISERGAHKANSSHTYQCRIKTILNDVFS